MDKKIMEDFNINDANSVAGEMERKVKIELQIIKTIRSITKIKGVERALESTNKSLENHIEKNKGYLTEAKIKAREAEMIERSEREKSEARIATLLEKEVEITKEIAERIKNKKEEEAAKWIEVERETASRINTAKMAAKTAEKEAAEAITNKGEMEEAFRLVKDKYLSV